MKKINMGMLAQITLFNVGFYMSGMNQWNGSRMQGITTKNIDSKISSGLSGFPCFDFENDFHSVLRPGHVPPTELMRVKCFCFCVLPLLYEFSFVGLGHVELRLIR